MIVELHPIFLTNNQLKIELINNTLEYEEFKLCFSLVYSIIKIEGGKIEKHVGRYYEIKTYNKKLILTLQTPRIGTYNQSCGPEGAFIINKKDEFIVVRTKPLKFENPIPEIIYSDEFVNKFNPIIPLPKKTNFNGDFITVTDFNFKVDASELEFLNNFVNFTNINSINFNAQEGFVVSFNKQKLQTDEYLLKLQKDKIIITYSDYGGKVYGVITLIQIINYYKKKIPVGLIEDKPKFHWRGMHLDCARQYYSIEQIKKLIDYMCLFKLNRFHWHLSDNEAWRLHLECYPNLTKYGSFRGYKELVPAFYGSGYEKSGGFYSKKQIQDLINYAEKRNIQIMPEIDLPAHSWTLLQIMPELRDNSANSISEDVGNYKNNTINPAVKDTMQFLNNILNEISEIFSFNIVHVGVDERPKESWEGSPKVIKYIKENNLSSFEELQDEYMNKIIKILKKSKKYTAAWNEAALPPHNDIGSAGSAGKVDKSCVIFAWEHSEVGLISAKKGYKTVLCPGQKTYFDMAYNNSTNERGICWAATIEVKEVFEWKPLQKYKDDESNNVLGIQGQLWSETITKKEYFDIMINPRLAALAEVAWNSEATRNWSEFRSSLKNNIEFLSKMGWKFHNF